MHGIQNISSTKIKPNSCRLQKEIAEGYVIRDLNVTAENRMAAAVKKISPVV